MTVAGIESPKLLSIQILMQVCLYSEQITAKGYC